METPFDVLTRVALLARQQEIAAAAVSSVSTPSQSPSPANSDPETASSSASRKRKARRIRLDEEKPKKRTPPPMASLSPDHNTPAPASTSTSNIQEKSSSHPGPIHVPPTTSAALPTTLSPCSCCGGPVHYSLPLRPTPYLAPPNHYAKPPPPLSSLPPQTFPHFAYSSPPSATSSLFKSSDASAFSPILSKTAAPPAVSIPAFPYHHPTPPEKTLSIARPLPIRPSRFGLPPQPPPPLYKNEGKANLGSADKAVKEKKSPTEVNIDEHFKRSLQGDRLRQFYPYPTDDKGSVENHFKRALGDEWNKVKEVESGQHKNNSLLLSIKTV